MSATKTCSRCKLAKPLADFQRNRRGTLGVMAYCRPCISIRQREARLRDPRAEKNRRLRSRFGMTLAEYERRLEQQGGGCAICGRQGQMLAVDHDHATGRVRGLLCHQCNTTLGLLGENPVTFKAAADYLETHRKGA